MTTSGNMPKVEQYPDVVIVELSNSNSPDPAELKRLVELGVAQYTIRSDLDAVVPSEFGSRKDKKENTND